MHKPGRLGRALCAIAATLLCFTGSIPPSEASPHDARILSIIQTACGSVTPCTQGATIRAGELVGGTLSVRVAAAADLGLEWVRLEAQNPGDPRWYCLELWDGGNATTLDQTRVWNTVHWTDPRKVCAPTDCSHCIENSPHHHGAPTEDLRFSLRVVAHETGSTFSKAPDDRGALFSFRIQNAPAPPTWLDDPSADSARSVLLQWAPNPEEKGVPPEPAAPPGDIREYRFVRVDPSGRRTAYAVSATRPGDQGCRRITTIAYECADRSLPSAGGTYRYAIAAVRGGFQGTSCELSPGTCVLGPLSTFRSVTVAAAPSRVATPNASAKPSSSSAPGQPTENAPEPVTTQGLTESAIGSNVAARTSHRSPVLLVLALLLAAGAAAVALRAVLARRVG